MARATSVRPEETVYEEAKVIARRLPGIATSVDPASIITSGHGSKYCGEIRSTSISRFMR